MGLLATISPSSAHADNSPNPASSPLPVPLAAASRETLGTGGGFGSIADPFTRQTPTSAPGTTSSPSQNPATPGAVTDPADPNKAATKQPPQSVIGQLGAPQDRETWGVTDPGRGFALVRTDEFSMDISIYFALRAVNQGAYDYSFQDHLGQTRTIDPRRDIQPHREQMWLKGWAIDPKLRYKLQFWTVNSTTQFNLVGDLSYEFSKAFTLYGGIGGIPGTRTMTGMWPYLLAGDRVLADEFFRPSFTGGIWANGEVARGLWYQAMVGNNLSQVGVKADQITRDLAWGATVWWMPSTGEFGPRGGFNDFEQHEKAATRFGTSISHSREDRYNKNPNELPQNTQTKLSTSVNVFAESALAPGVTVSKFDYNLLAADAGFKHKGTHFQTEFYYRWLNNIEADGPQPNENIIDRGFYVAASRFLAAKSTEVYALTSQIFGKWNKAYEYGGGVNIYPYKNRNVRANFQTLYVHKSSQSSLFGYYVGGMTGPVISSSFDIFF